MRVYFAPLEGITTAPFRRLHQKYFSGVDKYYAPFLSPTREHLFTARELRDIAPEYNEGVPLVPQLLTRSADDFLWAAGELAAMGYEEVNLNLGCPSGTVSAKGKGSGFLAAPDALAVFLDEVFSRASVRVSVKTRVGVRDESEFAALLAIYDRFPISELTVHPRIAKDFYKGDVRLAAFDLAVQKSHLPLCYNGDIANVESIESCAELYPTVGAVMIGRGLCADAWLAERYKGGGTEPAAERLRAFHDELFAAYRKAYGNDMNAVRRMKDLWNFMIFAFDGGDAYIKKLRKADRCGDYARVASDIFAHLPLRGEAEKRW
ncbi:MAG: tRNA-dihydrouridine synthase family protein [Oscillospiraceae bacterium]|nr:tRNA-dihydrouridine synthase family protein [Oscillospiraceae bacterium]